MKGWYLVALGSVALVPACGRTGLEDALVDSGGTTGDVDGGSSGRGSGGRGGNGASGGVVASGATGGSDSGGSGAVPADGGSSVGGSRGGSVGGGRGGNGQGGSAGTALSGMGGLAGAGSAGRAGQAGMAGKPNEDCGDGVVGPGEECDGGSEPSPPALELRQGAARYEVMPLVGTLSASAFYGYDSASSHTGFEGLGVSRLYLYRWSVEEAMSLVMHHGVDEDATGELQPESSVDFAFTGLPSTGVVVISDEPDELFRVTASTAQASWRFRRNTDGGVIGGLPFPGSWHITVTPSFVSGIGEFGYLSGTGRADAGVSAAYALDLSVPVEIIASDTMTGCRADCTVPSCGDGRLDPGEVCDDGNDSAGDGCAGCRPEL